MRFVTLSLAAIFLAGSAFACFGPKIYVGVGEGDASAIMYELVSLYLKEKTGVETARVDMTGKIPVDELDREGIDMLIVPAGLSGRSPVLHTDGWPFLFSGNRPAVDLRFTTVLPALSKLDELLSIEDMNRLRDWTGRGDSPASSVRRLLMEKGWI